MNKKINWPSQRYEYISLFIKEEMILAWLNNDCTIEDLYFLCRKNGLSSDLLFSEFVDTLFLLIEGN